MQTGTIAFLFGVLLLQLQPELPASPWLLGVVLFPPLLALLNRRLALLSAALLAGFGWALLHAHFDLADQLPAQLEGKELLLRGEVASLPERSMRRSRFLFAVEGGQYQGKELMLPSLVRLNWYQGAPELRPGQQWQLKVKLKRPRAMMNPGGFDYEQWLFVQGIRATGYVRASSENRLLHQGGVASSLQQWRYRLKRRLGQALVGMEHGGVIQSLAIGDRSGINDATWALLLATGTNHLMAISGLHIGLVAGLVYLLFLRIWRLCPNCCLWLAAPRAAALAATTVAVAYAALAGFSVPTQRAMLMLALVMGALFWQRPVAPSRTLSLALLLVLLHEPLVVLSPGFWLSFGAVALILYGMGGRLKTTNLWWRWGRVQWVVAVGLAPLLLLLFGQAALVAPLANLIAVPWIGMLVVPLALLGTLLLELWTTGGTLLLQLAAWFSSLIWPLLDFFAETVPALKLTTAPWWAYALAMAGVLWFIAPRGWPLRSMGGLALLPLLLYQPPQLAPGEARFTLLDVGQGLAAVVETRNRVLVFDTGPRFPSGFNTGSAVVLPYLHSHGWNGIDTLIISHGDNDHIGGARAITEKLPVARTLTSVPYKMGWIKHQLCRRGDEWEWDGVRFEMLHPQKSVGEGRGNNDSCVLRVSAGEHAVLLTGDIEKEAELEMVTSIPEKLHADVLIAPHHGSKTSSSSEFIKEVSAKWVLFPLGYRNRYGFPHHSVSERYGKYGVRMLSSSGAGAISAYLGGGALEIDKYREKTRNYWRLVDVVE